jgi:superfamily II DNA or RNA helicase
VPIPVELTAKEAQDYLSLSDQIARLFAAVKNRKSGSDGDRLKMLLMRRARLIGAAENKMVELDKLLERQKVQSHSLFYCSDGRTLVDADDDEYSDGFNYYADPFTSEENRRQRREILQQFKNGDIEAMVAIRCLDEGIDVPACRTAYLIASSRNPRQFIQRRGRILRRAPGKDQSTIYDFVVVMPEGHISSENAAVDFLRNELGRVADFARSSLYPASSINSLLPWLRKYGLEHEAA